MSSPFVPKTETKAGRPETPKNVTLVLMLIALPIYNVAFQFVAKSLGQSLTHADLSLSSFIDIIHNGWFLFLIAIEVIGFAIWMAILETVPLSKAFLLTAVSYVLIIAMGILVFHETPKPIQVVGSALILVGIILLLTQKTDTA